jgi:hypothetical protein
LNWFICQISNCEFSIYANYFHLIAFLQLRFNLKSQSLFPNFIFIFLFNDSGSFDLFSNFSEIKNETIVSYSQGIGISLRFWHISKGELLQREELFLHQEDGARQNIFNNKAIYQLDDILFFLLLHRSSKALISENLLLFANRYSVFF